MTDDPYPVDSDLAVSWKRWLILALYALLSVANAALWVS
jgi:hypothetical protein